MSAFLQHTGPRLFHFIWRFRTVRFTTVSLGKAHMRSAPSLRRCLWHCSNVRLMDDGPLSSFQGRLSSASSFHASLLQVIDSVMFLALCLQAVSQVPQHFRSTEMQAICDGCFARQSICTVISLYSDMSRAVHPLEFSKVDGDHWHNPVWASQFSLNSY